MEFKFEIFLSGFVISLFFGLGFLCWRASLPESGWKGLGYMFLGCTLHGLAIYSVVDLCKIIASRYLVQVLEHLIKG